MTKLHKHRNQEGSLPEKSFSKNPSLRKSNSEKNQNLFGSFFDLFSGGREDDKAPSERESFGEKFGDFIEDARDTVENLFGISNHEISENEPPNSRGGFVKRLLNSSRSRKSVEEILTQGRLEENVTRAEAAVIVLRILELDQSLPAGKIAYFNDVPESLWFFTPAHAARKFGLFRGGQGDNLFRPNATLSASEALIVLERARENLSELTPEDQVQGTQPILEPINALASLQSGASNHQEIADARAEVQNLPPDQQGEAYRQIASSVVYRNQRDNAGKHTSGDFMCNMTTIAMVLNQLGIGADESEKQLEDQLDEQLQADYDYPADTLAANPRYSRDKRAAWLKANYDVEVSTLYPDSSSAKNVEEWFKTVLLPLFEQGAGATMGNSPANGIFPYNHIVRVEWVNTDGLIIDDPFGDFYWDENTKSYKYALNGQESSLDEGARGSEGLWTWDMLDKINPSYLQVYSK